MFTLNILPKNYVKIAYPLVGLPDQTGIYFFLRELSSAFSCLRVYFRFIYNLFYVRIHLYKTCVTCKPHGVSVWQRQIRFCRFEAHNISSTDPFVSESWPPFLSLFWPYFILYLAVRTFSVTPIQGRTEALAKWRLPGAENVETSEESARSVHILSRKFWKKSYRFGTVSTHFFFWKIRRRFLRYSVCGTYMVHEHCGLQCDSRAPHLYSIHPRAVWYTERKNGP